MLTQLQNRRLAKIRKQNPSAYLYLWYTIDCTATGMDANILVRSNLFDDERRAKKFLRGLILQASGVRVRLYCHEPGKPQALASYVVKYVKRREHLVIPPKDWRGKQLMGGNRGFLVDSQNRIWKKVVEEAKEWNRLKEINTMSTT